jgi:lipopolysaccharide transport system ATP-binding protein
MIAKVTTDAPGSHASADSSGAPIVIRNVSKSFRLRTTRQRMSWAGGLGEWFTGKNRFAALDDINLEVQKGEILGIVGMNGSGKSTLLKLIAGIGQPTQGDVRVRGRVGSLIEVGAGFHPDLTGYENVYLNGVILGLEQDAIDDLMPEIVAFAGLEGFMDMPVKHYSSGMYMRLGFAVATQLEPDILLLDETLSVGDAEFQSRALKKVLEFQESGTTILMVSHDVFTIRHYCHRMLWLDQGKARMLGDPGEVVEAYREHLLNMSDEYRHQMLGMRGDRLYMRERVEDSPIRMRSIEIENAESGAIPIFRQGEPLQLAILYHCDRPVERVRVSLALVRTADHAVVLERDSERDGIVIGPLDGDGTVRCTVHIENFYSDRFQWVAAFFDPSDAVRLWDRGVCEFDLSGHTLMEKDVARYLRAPCRRVECYPSTTSARESDPS